MDSKKTFHIFTDNASNIPYEDLKKYDIKVIHIEYYIDDKAQEHDAPFDGKDFYAKMRGGLQVSTSMPNVSAFYEAFAPSLAQGYDVMYIGMSGGISGTAALAKTVAEELSAQYPDRKIETVDTRGASLGEGLPVLYAANLRNKRRSFEVVLAGVKEKCNHMHQVFVVDNLKYLQKTGRLFSTAVKITSTLNVKPILVGDRDGYIVLKSVTIGKKRAIDTLAKRYKEECTDFSAPVAIAHADAEDDLQHLIEKLKAAGCKCDIKTVVYEPVTGSHVGPGTVALFFYGDRRK